MPDYKNGYMPENLLVRFNSGRNATDGDWYHALTAATLQRHRNLVAIAKARTGRTLAISSGWSAYRPYAAQVHARQIHGVGAAVPGTSSHGGFWENRQTMAMDYGNWASVYDGKGGRNAFAEDCRKAGLQPNMIVPARGYPDEPWHVIDPNPFSAVPAGVDGSTPFNPEEDMPSVEEIMDYKIPRSGSFRPGEATSLRQIIAWFDSNIVDLNNRIIAAVEQKAHDVATHVTNEIGKIPAGGQVDPEVVRAAVTVAIEKALAGTSLDPAVTAAAVRAEFKTNPLA